MLPLLLLLLLLLVRNVGGGDCDTTKRLEATFTKQNLSFQQHDARNDNMAVRSTCVKCALIAYIEVEANNSSKPTCMASPERIYNASTQTYRTGPKS